MAPTHLTSALEELAKKRDEITSAIVTLASVAGVDARAYLTPAPGFVHVDFAAPGGEVNRVPKPDKPARPHKPASPTTSATGRADTVDDKGQLILDVLKQRGEPMQPKELVRVTKMSRQLLKYHLKPLLKAGKVTATGSTVSRRISLAA